MIFRTNNSSCFYGEAAGTMFCLLRVHRKSTDIYLTFIKGLMSTAASPLESTIKQWCSEVLTNYQFGENRLVKLHFFKKQLYGRVQNIDNLFSIFGNFDLSLNWIDYIYACRVYDLPEAQATFSGELTFAMLTKSAEGRFQPVLAITIDKDSFA